MAKRERKWLAHYIDEAFSSSSPSYVRLGDDLEEYNIELNADVEVVKNIKGEQSVKHNGYEVQSEVDPYYATEGSALFAKLAAIVNNRSTGAACETTVVDVLLNDDGTQVWAYREKVIVVPKTLGGDTSGIQIPFTVYYSGDRTAGTWSGSTFTPTSNGGGGGGT